ncbi:IclR family transcriptional regulator [uncultured Veillonella sp.]|uniref:IclR family transcriptional regulator n=1 Tax=uncultured Veillonella sp. TaxID=159268 RepID=UPI002629D128|nr:IclR family transcriptional regulator [uncultured Veillonella sp.]
MTATTVHRPTERVTGVLETLFLYPEGLSLTDLSAKLNIPKGTLQPILKSLEQSDFIDLDPITNLYRLGIKILILSRNVKENTDALLLIKKEMQKIVDKTNEICQLALLMNNEVFYLEKINAPNQIQLFSHVGKKLPANCTAIGKALLSTKSAKEIKKLFPEGLPKLTEKSIDDMNILIKECEKISKQHFAEEIEEASPDVACVAIPLQTPTGKGIAAISVSYPTFRFSPNKRDLIIQALLDSKQHLESIIAGLNINDLYS